MANYDRLDNSGLLYFTQQLKLKMQAMIPVDMTGAGASTAGAHGLVPAPAAGDNAKFLRGDGTWQNTPYPSDFTGADGTDAGAAGLVPAPAAADYQKFLKGDGTWAPVTIPDVPVKGVQKNGTDLTPDANGKVNVLVPVAVSELTNDSDFISSTAVDTKIATALTSTYKAGGSLANIAALPTLDAAHEGYVYNIESAFTTTADFVEGAGNSYPAGTNVAVVDVGTAQSPSYKYDVMAGFVDLSGYVQATEMSTISNSQIDTIITTVFGA